MTDVVQPRRRRRWLRIMLAGIVALPLVLGLALHLAIRKGSCSSDVPFAAALRTAEVAGRRVQWSLLGDPADRRPTLVLITGLGSGQTTFAAVLEGLARHGPVFAFDRPGYCGSERAPAGPRGPRTPGPGGAPPCR